MTPQTDKAEPLTDAEPLTAEELAQAWLKDAEYCASFREPLTDAPLDQSLISTFLWNHAPLTEQQADHLATGIVKMCSREIIATITQAQAARDDLLHNIRVLRARAEKAEANQRTPGTVEVCESLRNAGYYGPTCRTGDCPLRAAKDAT